MLGSSAYLAQARREGSQPHSLSTLIGCHTRLSASHHRLAELSQRLQDVSLARAVGFLATLFLSVPVFKSPLTMVSDPSQSQGLLTSPNTHGFRENEGLQSVQNDVWDAPQVHDPASEGLQSVNYDGRDAPQALAPPPLSPDIAYKHYSDGHAEKAGATASAGDVVTSHQPKRRRWIWAAIIAVVVAIAIAVGVGAGVGLTRKSNGNEKSANDAASTSAG